MSSVGDSMTGVGKSLSVGLTLPIVGVGVAAVDMARDVVDSTNKIQTGLGVTASEAEKLTEVAKDVWKNGFGENLNEATEAVINIKQSIKDISDVDLKTLTESAFTLKDAFGAEINESTRTASVMMKNFGISGQEAMDLITVGYQKGGNFSDELLDSLREYAPQFKGMGISAEDSLGILIKGAETGAFNLDKVG
jgi:phage-related minor tail protein